MFRNHETYPYECAGNDETTLLPFDDNDLMKTVVDSEATKVLYDTSPVIWLRAAIAVGSNRKPSEITNREIVDRLIDGGLEEWEPSLTHALTDYLQDQGYFIFN